MHEANIDQILERLRNRKDKGASREFIQIYTDVVKSYFRYKRWVEKMIQKNGAYQGKGLGNVVPSFHYYVELIEDIQRNGIKKPIQEVYDGAGYEVDGYHRLIIWKELGHRTIPIKPRGEK